MLELRAQPYYFNHYQVENGLSNNTVLCSMQDQNGFLWFGTKDGLNRFDGYSFKSFPATTTESNVPESNFIRALCEDSRGSLWVGTDQGLYLFEPLYERFRQADPAIKGEILDIQQDVHGDIWFISDLGLYCYQTSLQVMRAISLPHAVSAFRLQGDHVWAGTEGGEVIQMNRYGVQKARFSLFDHSPPSNDRRIESLFFTRDNRLLVGTGKQGMKLLDPTSGSYRDLLQRDYKNETIFVRDIIWCGDDEYWFATESGVIVYYLNTNRHTYLKKESGNPWALTDNAVYTLLKDVEGTIWAGTYFGGLNYYSRKNNFFEKYYPRTGENSIAGYAVREMVQDGYGHLWIGTEDNGLCRFDPETNRFTSFKPSSAPGSIAHSNIHGLLLTGDTLWVGTFEHGLDWMDIRTGKVVKHFDAGQPGGPANNFIFNMLKTRRGDVLLATGRGIYLYEKGSGIFRLHPQFPDYIFYTALYEDPDGRIWAGTWRDGLYFYDASLGKSGKMVHSARDHGSLRSNRVNRVFRDSRGVLWVATEGGLSYVSGKSVQFNHLTTKEGLPGNLVLAVLEDDDGRLWISTSRGLARFDPGTREIRTFTKANGLLSNQFNYNSAFKDPAGNLYFGSVNGLIRFQPRHFSSAAYEAPVYITGFQIHNEEVLIGQQNSPLKTSVSFARDVTLRHDEATFSIDFAALSFVSPAMTEYAYKMEGLDKTWNHLKTNRKVYFTNLAPGNYVFRVNVVDGSGKFRGKETALRIEVLPPLWAGPFAYFMYVIGAAALVFFLVKNYDARVKDRNRRRMEKIKYEREKSLYQAKIDFFTHVVHEIRTPLTMIKAPLEKLLQRREPSPAADKNLRLIEKSTDRLITLSGQLLDFRKVEADGFRMSFSLVNVTGVLREHYKTFMLSKKESIHMTTNLPAHSVYAELDEEAFVKIITNLLDNALKYCRQKVHLKLECVGVNGYSAIHVSVASDGEPVPENLRSSIFEPFFRIKSAATKQGTGLGLALCRSLAELLNGSLTLQVTPDFNIFILSLPQKHVLHDDPNTKAHLDHRR